LKIEKLSKTHDRSAFDCGMVALNNYLKLQASQDSKRDVATVIVAVDEGERVIGFYTLCASGLQRRDLPPDVGRRMPKYDMLPAILLGRLAVAHNYQRLGLGKRLMSHAFKRCAAIDVGWSFLVVDAKDERARSFYQRFEFISLLDDANHMCIPRQTILEAVRKHHD
jgi:GNAT superfamily N-acetyltransferase